MNSNKFRASLIALSSTIVLTTSFASSVSAQETTSIENAFSQCGIGAAIFKKNETAAIISNVIWDLGTTAFSSQTSSPSSCAGAPVKAAAFINETYPVIEEQLVKGSGSHVATLMDIIQCDESSQTALISRVQGELSESFSDPKFVSAPQTAKAKQVGAMIDRAMASCTA